MIVVNVSGTVRAFRAVCTHEGCPLGWNAQQHLIRCPCHGGAYDTSGRVVSGPPPAPLTELRAVVEHGSIYIPLGTMLVISLILSVVLTFFLRR